LTAKQHEAGRRRRRRQTPCPHSTAATSFPQLANGITVGSEGALDPQPADANDIDNDKPDTRNHPRMSGSWTDRRAPESCWCHAPRWWALRLVVLDDFEEVSLAIFEVRP